MWGWDMGSQDVLSGSEQTVPNSEGSALAQSTLLQSTRILRQNVGCTATSSASGVSPGDTVQEMRKLLQNQRLGSWFAEPRAVARI